MGTFAGHALPGSFFIVIALWWTVQMFIRYYSAQRKNTRFTSTAIFKCDCLSERFKDLPVEAFVKVFFASVGFSLEIYTGFSNGRFMFIGNGQHATMFFFFGFTGIVDILLHYKAPLPPDMDYISWGMAVTCEFVLFKFHLHGRKDLDVLLHTLLIYVIGACILSVMLEMKYRNNIICALTRPYFILLQGTWFWQVGWILYPPFGSSHRWDQEDHEQMMLANMMFAWHAAGCMLVMVGIGGLVAYLNRRFSFYQGYEGVAMTPFIHNSSDRDTAARLNDDSDLSDVECEKCII